jgi:type VI secretion system secreted protein VgrG
VKPLSHLDAGKATRTSETIAKVDLPIDAVNETHPSLVLELAGGASLGVRDFSVHEALHRLFTVELVCVSPSPDLDFESIVGEAGTFSIKRGLQARVFRGIVKESEQIECEVEGLSTYRIELVPSLWLATQNRTYRVFQETSDPEIALAVLGGWGISPSRRLGEQHRPRKYRVQYAESDFAFASRLLEDAGVTFYFDTDGEGDSALVLHDAPHGNAARASLPFVSQPTHVDRHDFVTDVKVERRVLPGRYTQEDVDYRLPLDFALTASASGGSPVETGLEVRHYNPGSFLFDGQGGDTPVADDRGAFRSDSAEGARQAEKRLQAKRAERLTCSFVTSALDVRPGQVLSVDAHPNGALQDARWLVVDSRMEGSATGDWKHVVMTCQTEEPYRPALATAKPLTRGIESATVVGPAGQEIHTDEFGRVRVHFHWDRSGPKDDGSSCWVPVSQPWGGTSFGAVNVPRIGQEVLVEFLNGDPDRPVVIGRVFTKDNPVPYELPAFKDVQGLRSASTPALPEGSVRSGILDGVMSGGGDGAGEASPQSSPLGGGLPFAMSMIEKLVGTSNYFQAQSPDGSTHQWQGSELTMHDVQGKEKVYLQSQKDFHKVVKNNQTKVVGHAQTETIATDDIRYVTNKESFKVGADRTGMVGGLQRELIQLAAYKESVDAGQQYEATESFTSRTKDHRFETTETFGVQAPKIFITSADLIHFRCTDGSQITLKPDGLLIQGANTHLNPGDAFTARAMQGCALSIAAMLAPGDQKKIDFQTAFDNATKSLNGYTPDYSLNGSVPDNVMHAQSFGEELMGKGYDDDEIADGYQEIIDNGGQLPAGPAPEYVEPPISI